MGPDLIKQLAALDAMGLDELRAKWTELFGTEAPGYNRGFLVKRLSYRVQELAYGGLGAETRARLDRVLEAEGYDDLGRPGKRAPARHSGEGIVPGTLLVRDYQGRRHTVTVTAEGFEYCGKPYRSLSPIAREITGTNWNGPAFFGLRAAGRVTVSRRDDDGR
jgi:hypothetical protein